MRCEDHSGTIVRNDDERALTLADELRTEVAEGDGAMECEIDDIEAGGHLGRYFAEKLRGSIALHTFRETGDEAERERAVDHLREARDHWDGAIGVTERHYREMPYATDRWEGSTFSWAKYRDQVERDVRIAREAESQG